MNVRVIPFCAELNREVRTSSYYPTHNQKFKKVEDFEKLWRYTIHQQLTIDAGCPVDTIFVLCGENELMEKTFAGVEGKRTSNGKIRVLKYDNSGQSWGALNLAFQTFKNDYDYWLFTEDDLIVLGDKYYQKVIEKFKEEPNTGFVALSGINRKEPIHAHNGSGLTTSKILQEVADANGGNLPHPSAVNNHNDAIVYGEIPYTNMIHKLGYNLVQYGKDGWHEDNLLLPYYNLCK